MNGYHPRICGDTRSEVLGLLESMRGALKTGAYSRAHQLTDMIEVFALEHLVPNEPGELDVMPGVHLTRKLRRIVSRLHEAKGKVVTREQLMNALYFDRAGDAPEIKIIDVFICKLRKRLPGTGYRIETIHGDGFALRGDS